jgi:hypothetical protein
VPWVWSPVLPKNYEIYLKLLETIVKLLYYKTPEVIPLLYLYCLLPVPNDAYSLPLRHCFVFFKFSQVRENMWFFFSFLCLTYFIYPDVLQFHSWCQWQDFILFWLNSVPLYISTTLSLAIDQHLGWVHILPPMNSATIKRGCSYHFDTMMSFLLEMNSPSSGLLDFMVILFLDIFFSARDWTQVLLGTLYTTELPPQS